MAKINLVNETLFQYLKRKFPFKQKENQESSIYISPEDYYFTHQFPSISGLKAFFIAPLQHFLDIKKDALDSIKPYKVLSHFIRDLTQPIRGLGNIAKGILIIVLSPLILMINLLFILPKDAIHAKILDARYSFGKNLLINLSRGASWIIDGLLGIFRGVTQIAATPLALAIKIPVRGIMTLIMGRPKIEDSSSIQKMVALGEGILNQNYAGNFEHSPAGVMMDSVAKAIHAKYQKGLIKGFQTSISTEEERKKFATDSRFAYHDDSYYTSYYGRGILLKSMSEEKINHARAFLSLFKKPLAQSDETTPILRDNIIPSN